MSWIKNTLLVTGSVVITLVGLELILRLFPVTEVIRDRPLSSEARPFDVSSTPNREYDYSRLWNFQNARTRRTNSQGFFSDFDYDGPSDGIVVIGDSFVAALQVDFEDTFHQQIGRALSQKIVNFGIDGSPLSQYEAYLSEVCEQYGPSMVVIPIVSNDFDESLYSHRKDSGFFHYREGDELRPTTYNLSPIRRVANQSSLIRYLYFHLGVGSWVRQFTNNQGSELSAVAKDEKFSQEKFATDIFLRNMAGYCLAPGNIIFVVDALRNEEGVYGQGEVVAYMHEFVESAGALGYAVIDLNDVMRRDYQEKGQKFEFPFDQHWNQYGHKIVANTLLKVLDN